MLCALLGRQNAYRGTSPALVGPILLSIRYIITYPVSCFFAAIAAAVAMDDAGGRTVHHLPRQHRFGELREDGAQRHRIRRHAAHCRGEGSTRMLKHSYVVLLYSLRSESVFQQYVLQLCSLPHRLTRVGFVRRNL